jgi:hypothetical protein
MGRRSPPDRNAGIAVRLRHYHALRTRGTPSRISSHLDERLETLLKGGVGRFYDRVPLLAATFAELPDRTVTPLVGSHAPTFYENTIDGALRNPRSSSWNVELDREITRNLLLRFAYEQRHTTSALNG